MHGAKIASLLLELHRKMQKQIGKSKKGMLYQNGEYHKKQAPFMADEACFGW